MPTAISIGLLGCGTVGEAVVRILTEQSDLIQTRTAGRAIQIRKVVLRDPAKLRRVELPSRGIRTEPTDLLQDRRIKIVVELIGGIEPARTWIEAALRAGKDVITANKALLAERGPELVTLARDLGRVLMFEAAAGGGVPMIGTLRQSLAANRILGLSGILNGTSHYMLHHMHDQGSSWQTALSEAARLGYAEANCEFDVNGSDAAQKLALLAQLAFHTKIDWKQIPRRGMDSIGVVDVNWSRANGMRILPLAVAHPLDPDVPNLYLTVHPALLPQHDRLAGAEGPENVIAFQGDALGTLTLRGHGAGGMPTASAVVSDLIDIVLGRARATQASAPLWDESWPAWVPPAWSPAFPHYLRVFSRHTDLARTVHTACAHCNVTVTRWEPIDGGLPGASPGIVATLSEANLLAMTHLQAQLHHRLGPEVETLTLPIQHSGLAIAAPTSLR